MRVLVGIPLVGILLFSLQTAALAQSAAMPAGVKTMGGVLADAKGRTLYTFDYDTQPGQSACAGDCLVQWPALAAAADAKPAGDWTSISRSDGTKQWAFKDKPLYTFYQDTKPGDKNGDGNSQIWHVAMP
jgi:predicted lipoprotein with Yx(FWY)xxD motif